MSFIAHTTRTCVRVASGRIVSRIASAVVCHAPTAVRPTLPIQSHHRRNFSTTYDPSSYSNPPTGPDYHLPNDAPPGTYELFYFALRGRAEQIRLLLVESGLPYKDRLLTQWQLRKLKATGSPISNPNFLDAQLKSPLPFGGLPLLRRGDIFIGQTSAILQFLAEDAKLMPATPIDRARAQMIVAGTEDLFQTYWPIKLDQNRWLYHSGSFPLTPGTHESYITAPPTYLKGPFDQYAVPRGFRRESLPRWLTYFDALLAEPNSTCGSGKEYFVGNQLSYADIVVFAHLDACRSIEPECISPFPLLNAHFQRIGARPKIKTYMESRPQSGL